MKNIVVLCGGISTERNVSIKTGNLVCKSLNSSGYNAILLDVYMGISEEMYFKYSNNIKEIFLHKEETLRYNEVLDENVPDIKKVKDKRVELNDFDFVSNDSFFGNRVIDICKSSDMVFLALHGDDGENGKLQATFDLLGIKYTGTDYASSLVSMDKKTTKALLVANNILTPKEYLINEENNNINVSKYPVVVKPNIGGSSIGVTIAKDETEFKVSVDNASKYDSQIIVEEYIKGREFSVGILGDNILPAIEIIPKAGFYDYKNKYQSDMTIEVCPANISKNIVNKMNNIITKVKNALGLKVYSRVDVIMDENENIYVLEANTLPGLTNISLLPQEAQAIGINYDELCIKILELSEEKWGK